MLHMRLSNLDKAKDKNKYYKQILLLGSSLSNGIHSNRKVRLTGSADYWGQFAMLGTDGPGKCLREVTKRWDA